MSHKSDSCACSANSDGKKACTRCGEVKQLTEYHRSSYSGDGRKSWCKTCALAAAEKRRSEHRDKCNAAIKAAKAKNPEKYREIRRAGRRAHPEWSREQMRRDAARMGDTYIKRLLVQQGFGSFANVSAEILELKRKQVETRRLARQLKEKAHESSKDTR